jgi:hypothetical protein
MFRDLDPQSYIIPIEDLIDAVVDDLFKELQEKYNFSLGDNIEGFDIPGKLFWSLLKPYEES